MIVLVHLAAGIGNIVLATPLLTALQELGYTTDVSLRADYPETAELLDGWSAVRRVVGATAPACRYDAVIPAVPPFYWRGLRPLYANGARVVTRPADALFYEDEQGWYLEFARKLGYPADRRPPCSLPIAPAAGALNASTVILAPGCKTGEMACKRWPHFPALAGRFERIAVIGTADDLVSADSGTLSFPSHARVLAGKLSLRQTAEFIASAGVVVANDSGLGHVSIAVGTPTVMLFGPTPDRSLGPFPPHAVVLRSGLPCEPCWFGRRFEACARRIDCLQELPPDRVERVVRRLLFGA